LFFTFGEQKVQAGRARHGERETAPGAVPMCAHVRACPMAALGACWRNWSPGVSPERYDRKLWIGVN
jgi:hypothetical protein